METSLAVSVGSHERREVAFARMLAATRWHNCLSDSVARVAAIPNGSYDVRRKRKTRNDGVGYGFVSGETVSASLEVRITRAITLLEANGYKVTKKAPRGAPRRVDRAAILALVKKNPEITNAEGAAIIGCSPDMFAKVRGNRA